MSKHMTIINLACTITKVRKWGEAWKHSAESAQAASAELHRKHKEAERIIETLRANLTQTEAESRVESLRLKAELAVVKDERDQLRVERDALRAQLDAERAPKPVDVPRAHPVAVGEWVERTSNEYDPNTKIGAVAQVVSIDADGDYQVAINGVEVCWSAEYCTPCDPPTASHITPAGKETAQAAAEPKPGDTVRLVKVPTCNDYGHAWILEWGAVGNMGKVCKIRSYPFGNVAVVDIDARLSYEWPLSCVEVVRGGDK